ncbi:Pectinesterase 5 [Zea mays]|uniref:Pectinesterase 5 n=1 Tax=Zea mays TaxID=4577 RepID=A0A1D6E985_MAIZE|nr:Pectinesterase 5 [Zea mays]
MDNQQNSVTAHGRTDPNMKSGLVIQNCRLVPDQKLFPDRFKIPSPAPARGSPGLGSTSSAGRTPSSSPPGRSSTAGCGSSSPARRTSSGSSSKDRMHGMVYTAHAREVVHTCLYLRCRRTGGLTFVPLPFFSFLFDSFGCFSW